MNVFIETMNSIQCTYTIDSYNINKNIQIINNGYYDYKKLKHIVVNKDIGNKVKIMIDGKIKSNIMEYKFEKAGNHKVYK
jgi:hypothetical protein